MSLWEYANPVKFMKLSGRMLPWLAIISAATLLVGLIWGFFFTPEDYKQGASVKIIFLHVPSALMAINAWLMMLVVSLIWFIRRHHVSALVAKAAAPVGVMLTIVAIATGAVWGKPMWGTYWAWDPRLTSFAILLVFYFGYIALWQAIENKDLAADLTAMLCVVGSVFALLSRYAVNFWSQGLHQGTSIPVATGQRSIHDAYFLPLALCMVAFAFLFVTLVILRTRTEIRARRLSALQTKGAAND